MMPLPSKTKDRVTNLISFFNYFPSLKYARVFLCKRGGEEISCRENHKIDIKDWDVEAIGLNLINFNLSQNVMLSFNILKNEILGGYKVKLREEVLFEEEFPQREISIDDIITLTFTK